MVSQFCVTSTSNLVQILIKDIVSYNLDESEVG